MLRGSAWQVAARLGLALGCWVVGLKVVGYLFELLAGLSSKGPAADFAELVAQGALVLACYDTVCHVEEDAVLFAAKQP